MPHSRSLIDRQPLDLAGVLHRQGLRQQAGYGLALLLWAGLSLPFWANYLPLGASSLLALLPAPLVLRHQAGASSGWRYAPWAMLCLVAYPFLHSQICLFMGSGLALLTLIESRGRRISRLAPVFLLLLSPLPELLVDVFSFSLRLHLSAWTADSLRLLGYPVVVHGNTFVIEGQRFVIEAACLGLNMVVTGLVATTFLLAQAERAQPWPAWRQALVYLVAFGLLMVSNFARTLMLVLLRSEPGTLSHELTGLFSLLIYVLLPVAWLVQRWRPRSSWTPSVPGQPSWVPILLVLGGLVFGSGYHFLFRSQLATVPVASAPAGWEVLPQGTWRQESDGILCYKKPPVPAWRAGHDPLVCWQGSGYQFQTIEQTTVGGKAVYLAELKREDLPEAPLLYTAWWYSNGHERQLNPWMVRWRQLQGASPFFLINLTADNREALKEAIFARSDG